MHAQLQFLYIYHIIIINYVYKRSTIYSSYSSDWEEV